MKHHPFEDWLFAEDPLTPEQSTALQTHRQACEDCDNLAYAWNRAEHALRTSPTFAPRPGFSSRWLAQLEAERQRLARRQSLALLGFCITGATFLFGSLALLALPALAQPSLILWNFVYQLVQAVAFLQGAESFISGFSQGLLQAIPWFGWMFIFGMISEVSVLWLVALRWLTNPRRES